MKFRLHMGWLIIAINIILLLFYIDYTDRNKIKKLNNQLINLDNENDSLIVENDSLKWEVFIQSTNVTRYEILIERLKEIDSVAYEKLDYIMNNEIE
jgi:hypothetical protein